MASGETKAQPLTIDPRLAARFRQFGRYSLITGIFNACFGTFILWLTGFFLPFGRVGDPRLWAFPIVGFVWAVIGFAAIGVGLHARLLSRIPPPSL